MSHATASYGDILAQRIQEEQRQIAARWLERLITLIPASPGDVFPTEGLLDHIPAIVYEIAEYLRAPASAEIAANTSVITKARELGLLRHQQRAAVHQLLREYEILGGILENFIAEETERLQLSPPPSACFDVYRRISRAVRTLMQTTVDTFISEYSETILQQTKRLEGFNRTVSHELKTPLATLHFAIEMLGRDGLSSDPRIQARIIDVIRRSTERALALVRDLERLARAETAPDIPSQQFVEVGAIAHEVARQLRDMADAREVEIRIAPDLPSMLVDSSKLELILINLVSNAIKYSDREKPERFVEIGPIEGAGDETHVLRVQDNGLGIPAAALPTIFNRFVRAHADRDYELGVDGTGLGLSIVREAVKALNGTVSVESVEGRGTIFILALPPEPPRS